MILKIAVMVVLTLIGAVLYRLGGWEKGHKLFRRLGCGLLALGVMIWLRGIDWGHWWAYLLFVGINYGALSTYHDYLAPDKKRENWLCWLMTGICYGLAAFPLCATGVHWYGVLIRTAVMAPLIMLWSEWLRLDWLEEGGRGMFYIATLPLLLI